MDSAKLSPNSFYKYNGIESTNGFIPGVVYKYSHKGYVDFFFVNEFGNMLSTTDVSDFVKSGMQECNWITRNNNARNHSDSVNHPSHYNNGSVEVIDQMITLFGKEKVKAFCELNAFKYRMRAGLKGDAKEDIEKAIWYETKYKNL